MSLEIKDLTILLIEPSHTQSKILKQVLSDEGICKIDISGVLGGALITNEYRDDTTWVGIPGASWDDNSVPAPVLPAVDLPLINVHQIRFVLQNSGASTDISVILTYDA